MIDDNRAISALLLQVMSLIVIFPGLEAMIDTKYLARQKHELGGLAWVM